MVANSILTSTSLAVAACPAAAACVATEVGATPPRLTDIARIARSNSVTPPGAAAMAALSLRSCCIKNSDQQVQMQLQAGDTHLVGVVALRTTQLKLGQRDVECTGSIADANNVRWSAAATGTHKQHVQLPNSPVHIPHIQTPRNVGA